MLGSSYREQLKQQAEAVIDALDLPDAAHKQFLRARWLDQVLWLEEAASRSLFGYTILRLTTIVGSVLIPSLVSLTVPGSGFGVDADAARWGVFVVSLLVALSAALEQFFHFGERWRHYRRTAEALKSAGWQFFQLSNQYRDSTHASSYPAFAARVEELATQDVDVYFSTVVRERQEPPSGTPKDPGVPRPATGTTP